MTSSRRGRLFVLFLVGLALIQISGFMGQEVARPWRDRIIEKKDEEDSGPPDAKGALRGLEAKTKHQEGSKKSAASESFVLVNPEPTESAEPSL
mmetsp:Transcript_47758/g.104179  ORF Transcript_47758/g.104179 Transcript_47758/m.104179 type:complete len:94 (-) Transcript_47758:150-431(-)